MSSVPASPHCTICNDTGWMPASDDNDLNGVRRCDCYKRARLPRLLEFARIPPRYKEATLDNYKPGDNPWLKNALLIAQLFVDKYPTAMPTGLLFMGRPGLGKTHLVVGIIKAIMAQKNRSCLFCDFPDLLREIQNSYNPMTHGSEKLILAPILDAEVLVLDDLGCQKWSEWVQDILGHVINDRYNRGHVTIFTTNYLDPRPAAEEAEALNEFLRQLRANGIIDERGDLDQFKKLQWEKFGIPLPTRPQKEDTLEARIGERLRSRLNEMCKTVKVHGEDYRKKIDRDRRSGEILRRDGDSA